MAVSIQSDGLATSEEVCAFVERLSRSCAAWSRFDRRTSRRYPLATAVRVRYPGPDGLVLERTAEARDVCVGGMTVVMLAGLAAGTQGWLQLPRGVGPNRPIKFSVVHCEREADRHIVGVAFLFR
jgi:hypothetical protein